MPTTTNLALTYPSSTAYVTNGASDMGTLATDIDNLYGALTTYTPTLTNVTAGAATGRFRRLGKIGVLHVQFTAGTATAAAPITVSQPTGWTILALGVQALNATNGTTGLVTATSTGTTITVYASSGTANFGIGATVAGIRITGWLLLQ